MKKDLKNIAASVRQRLYNRAQETHRPFDELLQYFGMERFLYRLSKTEYRNKVILKGALITGRLGQARINMQIDIGFGDTIFPKPEIIDYPSLLDMPRPQLKGYPRETVVAEKFEAMVNLEMLNSRMKDFYDIWLLANQFNFDGQILGKALSETFAKRKKQLTVNPVALSDDFVQNPLKRTQWAAFIRKGRLDHAPKELEQVILILRNFLTPVVEPLTKGHSPHLIWKAPGPWKPS